MATDLLEDRLLDLLIRWEELGEEGHVEELCADCPELLRVRKVMSARACLAYTLRYERQRIARGA
jgi:hypothetical protein